MHLDGAPLAACEILEPASRGVECLVNGHVGVPVHAGHSSFLEVLGSRGVFQGGVLRWFVFNHDRRAVRDGKLYRDMKAPSIAVVAMGHLNQHSARDDVRIELCEPGDTLDNVGFELG